MVSEMDVGVIGVGTMGKNHVRVFSELKGVGDLFVYDPLEKNANSAAEYATVCPSLESLLDSVEAVSICVPTKYHHDVACKVIDSGVHFLLEKPITLTLEEAKDLLQRIEGSDLTVGVGHIERFNPIVVEISKVLGQPAYVEIKRHNPTSARITDSSVVEDLMIHDIDIIFNVLFPNVDDYKIFSAGNRNVCEATIVFGDSVVALSASRLSSKKFRTFYVEEESFTIEGDFMTQEVYIYRKPGRYLRERDVYIQENIIEKLLVSKVEPLKVELKTFLECVRTNRPFPVTPAQAFKNMKVCSEISDQLSK